MKKILIALFSVLITCIAVIAIGIVIASRDSANPDTSDLTVIRPEIAPEANAYTYFNAATNGFYWPDDSEVILDYLVETPVDPVALSEFFTRNTQMFACINQGVKCQYCITPAVTNFNTTPMDLWPWLNISRVMEAKIRYERLTKQYAEATENCILLLRFGNLIQKNSEVIVHYCIGVTALENGLYQAKELALDSKMPPAELNRLASALKEVGPLFHGFDRALKTEFIFTSNTLDQLRDKKLKIDDLPGFDSDNLKSLSSRLLTQGYFFQPNKTKYSFAEYYRKILAITPLPYIDIKRLDIDKPLHAKVSIPAMLLRPNVLGRLFYRSAVPSMQHFLEAKCQMECSLAATRLLVACQQYRHAHGKFPNDLQALVPIYLSCVPTDPYDGKPFRYDASRGIIYSIGKDLQDSGGSTNSLKGVTTSDDQKLSRWDAEDAVYEVEAKVRHE
jgi:hypothetical protein